jgi:hypothetical protein
MPDIFIGSEEVRVVDGPFTSRVPVVAILNPTTGLPAFPSGGGGGGGDASAANQTTQIAAANALNTAFGAQADAMATTDTGAASLLALHKRIAQHLQNVNNKLPASIGAKASALSLSVTQDSDTTWRTRAFQPTPATGAAVPLTAATTSAAQGTSGAGTVIRFGNSGGAPITIEFGTSGVAASANSLLEIMPGTSEAIMVPSGATHFAAFCASAATLKWIAGTGS